MIPRVVAVLPARYESSRFPGKPLALILGRPMIWWTATRTHAATLIDDVIIATDDERIAGAARDLDLKVVMTRADHQSGTDRVAEAVASLDADLVLNVQGDEPTIAPRALDALVQPFLTDSDLGMATLAVPVAGEAQFHNPDRVKVVVDRQGFALYFSRSPIPYPRDRSDGQVSFLLHVGIYAFRRDALFRFTGLRDSRLEAIEKLEQLRALEFGIPIKVVTTDFVGHGVDRPEDIALVEEFLRAAGNAGSAVAPRRLGSAVTP